MLASSPSCSMGDLLSTGTIPWATCRVLKSRTLACQQLEDLTWQHVSAAVRKGNMGFEQLNDMLHSFGRMTAACACRATCKALALQQHRKQCRAQGPQVAWLSLCWPLLRLLVAGYMCSMA